MPMLTEKQIEEILKDTDCIRNVCLFGSPGHGRLTVSDNLISSSAIIIAQDRRVLMGDVGYHDEINRFYFHHGKLPFFPLYHTFNNNQESNKHLLVNLFNNNGEPIEIDENDERCSNNKVNDRNHEELRNVDGALGIVSGIEQVTGELKDQLYEVIKKNRVEVIVMITKLDRMYTELQMSKEQCYQSFVNILKELNQEIRTFSMGNMKEEYFHPVDKMNVIFGSGLHSWGFSIDKFASLYSQKFGISKEKLRRRFWGENYFDSMNKKWRKKNRCCSRKGKEMKLQRTFCKFILAPIFHIYKVCLHLRRQKLDKILKSLNLHLENREKSLDGKRLLQVVMRKFLNLGDEVMNLIQIHIPPPKVAQTYRKSVIYGSSRSSDVFSHSISRMSCEDQTPLMMVLTHTLHKKRSVRGLTYHWDTYYVGRIFSGKLKKKGGKSRRRKVQIVPISRNKQTQQPTIFHAEIMEVAVMVGRNYFQPKREDLLAGNICAIALDNRKHHRECSDAMMNGGLMVFEKGVEFNLSNDDMERAAEEEMERMNDCMMIVDENKYLLCVAMVGGLKMSFLRILAVVGSI